jgi:hypothetical protein
MKIAYISVIARHPQALDLHIRNVRWALPDAKIYIFTFADWNFPKDQYPDVTFFEVNANPWQYYFFWEREIHTFLLSQCQEDVLIFKQNDMLFHRKIQELITDDKIILNVDQYHTPITKNGNFVYPFIWEGGCIVPGGLLRKALVDWGMDLSNRVFSEALLKNLAKTDKLLELGTQRLAAIERGQSFDHFCQFCFYCLLNDIPVEQQDMVCHCHPLEALHEKMPDLYSKDFTKDFLDELSRKGSATKIVFHLLLSQAISFTPVLKDLFRGSPKSKALVRQFRANAKDWMSNEQWGIFMNIRRLVDDTSFI